MAQTTTAEYGYTLPIAQAGQLADNGFRQVDSYSAEENISFGLALRKGTSQNQCAILDTAGQGFLGLAIFSQSQEQGRTVGTSGSQSSTGALYRTTDTVSTLRRGRAYVRTNFATVGNDPAFVDVYTTGKLGRFTPLASTTVLTFSADFVTSNTINGSINSQAITQITYATSHAATFAALVAEIEDTLENDLGIATTDFSVTGNAVARTIVITSKTDLTLTSFAVTNGASQATVTVPKTSNVSTGGTFRLDAAADALSVIDINLP